MKVPHLFAKPPSLRSLSLLLAAAVPLAGGAGCSSPREPATSGKGAPVVYGNDDRQDVYAYSDQAWAAQAANFAAAMIPLSEIDQTDPTNVVLSAQTLQEFENLCPGERFPDQITAAYCSSTLIAPDIVLTAGHCIQASSCSQNAFVFDYYMTDASTLHTITADDVYPCQEVLARQQDNAGSDFSVVKLDRPVVGRTPAPVQLSPVVETNGSPLVINGYPTGLPLKIDNGGQVRDQRDATLDYFVANLDTFGGNSGSGVFDQGTGLLTGILVRGEQDYVFDSANNCNRVNVCPSDGCRGEDSTYAFRAIDALCAASPQPGLCPCGDGTCDAAGGETTVTCPLDCGTQCGDGACNGDESPVDCPEDCGTCGNGTCDEGEDTSSCCSDCGCSDGADTCQANQCVPGPGDTCDRAVAIDATGTQTIAGDTSSAQDDYAGSCVGTGARDRVYSFTLDAAATVDAQVSGFDTGLYLRSGCTDSASEVTCDDDATPPGNLGSRITTSLEAGTYYLFVNGYSDAAQGAFTLTVTFTGTGGMPDAGPMPDAGGTPDAAPLPDAGTPDAAPPPDAGSTPDAAPMPDAGTPDAAPLPDAGAAMPDAGAAMPDASAPGPDASAPGAPDAGSPRPDDGGCSAAGGGTGASAGLLLLAALMVAPNRRRRHRRR